MASTPKHKRLGSNIDRLLNWLRRQIIAAQVKGAPAEEMNKAWDLIEAFGKTAEGKKFDKEKHIGLSKEELLKLAYAAINTCEKNQKPIS